MGMCGGAPKAPDLTPIAEAMEKQSERAFELGEKQQAWAEEMWAEQWSQLQPILGTQHDVMQWSWDNARKDRARYEKEYLPVEDQMREEALTYDSPQQMERDAARAQAAVKQAGEVERQNALARLEGYGIDPSQTRSEALDKDARVQLAAQEAAAGNQAREQTKNVARALKADVVNIGRGMPSQAMQGAGQATQAGTSANANFGSAVQTGASTMGTGGSWMQQGMQGLAGSANVHSQGYQNKLAGFGAQSGTQQMLGQAIGAGIGAAGGMMANEGGLVPEGSGVTPMPAQGIKDYDDVPAMLTEGEFVIPAEVVRAKGTEFFDRLIEKTRGA